MFCSFSESNAPAGFELKRRRPQAEDPEPAPWKTPSVKIYGSADFDGPLLAHVRDVNAAAPPTLRDLVWALACARDGASDLDKFKYSCVLVVFLSLVTLNSIKTIKKWSTILMPSV